MHQILETNIHHFDKTIDFFKHDISSLRTGRVSPSLVEGVKVESYGTISELITLASISTPEPYTIVIKPWDKSILKDIERAIRTADLNINPVVDSEFVRLNFPPLTEESRKNLVKILNKKAEEAKVALRGQREKIKDSVQDAERNKDISEDEKFQALKELDELTKQYGDKIKVIADQKEAEIMKI